MKPKLVKGCPFRVARAGKYKHCLKDKCQLWIISKDGSSGCTFKGITIVLDDICEQLRKITPCFEVMTGQRLPQSPPMNGAAISESKG